MSFLRGLVFSLAIVVLATLGLAGARWGGLLPAPSGGSTDVADTTDQTECPVISSSALETFNERVVDLYAQGDKTCAKELALRAIDKARAKLNEGDTAYIDAVNNLARLEAEDENWDAAAELYAEVVDFYADTGQDFGIQAAEARFRLAAALGQAGKPREANKIYEEARSRAESGPDGGFGGPEEDPPELAARGIGEPDVSGHSEIDVFYGTDRAPQIEDGVIQYTSDQDGSLHLGVATVTIPASHTYGELESPSIWRLEFRPNPDRHVILRSVDELDPTTFQSALERYMQKADSREAFVFIHGYNVTFEDAARRTAQMAYDMKFPGAPIFYSWPSRGQLLSYARDETMVQRTAPYFSDFLQMVARESGAETVHLIAHSMGNRALVNALKLLDQNTDGAEEGPLFNEILLTAPDIDVEVFRQVADSITAMGNGTTLYASANDKALGVSRRLRSDLTRLGDTREGIAVIPNIESIDASLVPSDFLGHGYFADSQTVLSDIDLLIDTGQRAEDRGLPSATNADGQTFWRVQPCGATALSC